MEINTVPNPKGTLIIGHLQGGAPAAQIASSTPAATSTTTSPAQPTTPTPVRKISKLDLEAALMAIIRVHQQVHIEYKSKGGAEEVFIEGANGLTHSMKRKKGRLTFKWDPKTPKELKELVAYELKSLAG
jgi:hypothetical protein